MAHKQNTTKCSFTQQAGHTLALLSLLALALLGQPLESQAGWIACPPAVSMVPQGGVRRRKRRTICPVRERWRQVWRYGLRSWQQPLVRSLLLATLWTVGGKPWPGWIVAWPWLLWLWQVLAVFWPELGEQPLWRAGHQLLWQGQRVVMVIAVALALKQGKQVAGNARVSSSPLSVTTIFFSGVSSTRETS